MVNKYMKRCLTLSVIRKMQTKSTMRYSYTSMRMAKIKKTDNTKCVGKNMKQLELSYTDYGNINGITT